MTKDLNEIHAELLHYFARLQEEAEMLMPDTRLSRFLSDVVRLAREQTALVNQMSPAPLNSGYWCCGERLDTYAALVAHRHAIRIHTDV